MKQLEVRFHARGNQGMVTAAEIFVSTAHDKWLYPSMTPRFGAAKAGEPICVDVRVGGAPINVVYPVIKPDILVVSDDSLIGLSETLSGAHAHTVLLVNSLRSAEEIAKETGMSHVYTVNATEIGNTEVGLPYPNSALLGLLAQVVYPFVEELSPVFVAEALVRYFHGEGVTDPSHPALRNLAAFKRGYSEFVVWDGVAEVHAPHTPTVHQAKRPPMEPGAVLSPLADDFVPKTGDLRTMVPVLDLDRCEHCFICWQFCPDKAFVAKEGKILSVDLAACKGCGVCEKVCPPKFNAIIMKEDQ